MTVAEAHRALTKAEQEVRDAEAAVEHARNQLDDALAVAGWRRIGGAFNPGVRFYGSPLYPGATLKAEQIVEVLEQQRKAAAA